MLVRSLGSVAGVDLIQILTFVLHSNWFIINMFRTICAKMLLFCKVMVFHTSVSSKRFCGLVLLSDHFRELCWGMGKWLFRAGPRMLFDVRTAPGQVITRMGITSAHLRCLKLTWYIHHKCDSLSLFNLFVSFKLRKGGDARILLCKNSVPCLPKDIESMLYTR